MTTTDDFNFPPLRCNDVDACKMSAWHSLFRAHTPKTSILPLPASFIRYLEADGIVLPLGSDAPSQAEASYEPESDDDEDEDESWSFPELDAAIRKVLDKYEAVFPKFNWSAPQDAQWMLANPSLKCLSPADVYLLLKSSDFVIHDLTMAYDDCSDVAASRGRDRKYELVLRKWFDMPRSSEWRCFVRDRKLIGLCQRDLTYYSFLQEASLQGQVRRMVQDFFDSVILPGFSLQSFTFDIYFTRSLERIFLIDFNPYAPRTDALLFTWSDLATLSTSASTPDLRVISNPMAAQGTLPRFSHNAYPADVVQLSHGVGQQEFQERWKENVVDALAEGLAEQRLDQQEREYADGENGSTHIER